MGKIQTGFLVSYDYKLIQNALPPIYAESDTIFLAIDKNRKTWKGETFDIDPAFFDWVKSVDKDNKIVVWEDDFYVPGLTTMECEVRERKMLAEKMGIGNWLLQLDSDEYFYDFKSFVDYLKSQDHFLKKGAQKVQICPFKVNLYKYVDEGVLYVEKPEKYMLATNYPNYKIGRRTKTRCIYVNNIALHDCISRERGELLQKLENWGHNTDIDKDAFMQKWDMVNKSNYKDIQGFFYLEPMRWKTLEFMPGRNIEELLANFKSSGKLQMPAFYLMKKNFGQWFKFLFKK